VGGLSFRAGNPGLEQVDGLSSTVRDRLAVSLPGMRREKLPLPRRAVRPARRRVAVHARGNRRKNRKGSPAEKLRSLMKLDRVSLLSLQSVYRWRLMHDDPVPPKCCDALSGFADQNVVGSRCGAGADAEQGDKGSMPCAAPIEAEHEFIKVVLEVGFPQPVIDAQAPPLEV